MIFFQSIFSTKLFKPSLFNKGYLSNMENNGLLQNSGNQKSAKKKKRRTAAEIQKEFEVFFNFFLFKLIIEFL